MRILHVVGSLDPRMGGLPRAVAGLAFAQVRAGVPCTLAFCGPSPEQGELLSWGGEKELPPQLNLVSLPRVLPRLRSASLSKRLNEIRPDWVQTHGLWEPVLHACLYWALENGIPCGITPHSMMHPWHQQRKRMIKRWVKNFCGLEGLWRGVDLLQALTPQEADHWRETISTEKIRVIPNGISPDADAGNTLRTHTRLPAKPFLLFMGRLHAQKAPEVLLEAFAQLAETDPELHLVLAGPDDGLRNRLLQRCHRLGLVERVHVPGSLDRYEKWDALHRCTLFCLPSRAEGFSLAVLEASLAGACCLISEECGFPELVQAGGARQIPGNADGIASVCRQLLSEPEERKSIGEVARRMVKTNYTWEQMGHQFTELIRERLHENSA